MHPIHTSFAPQTHPVPVSKASRLCCSRSCAISADRGGRVGRIHTSNTPHAHPTHKPNTPRPRSVRWQRDVREFREGPFPSRDADAHAATRGGSGVAREAGRAARSPLQHANCRSGPGAEIATKRDQTRIDATKLPLGMKHGARSRACCWLSSPTRCHYCWRGAKTRHNHPPYFLNRKLDHPTYSLFSGSHPAPRASSSVGRRDHTSRKQGSKAQPPAQAHAESRAEPQAELRAEPPKTEPPTG